MFSILKVKNTACQSKLMTVPKKITLTLLTQNKVSFIIKRSDTYLVNMG